MNGFSRHIGGGCHAFGGSSGRRGKADFDIEPCKHLNDGANDGGFARARTAGDDDHAFTGGKADGIRLKTCELYTGIRFNLGDFSVGVE